MSDSPAAFRQKNRQQFADANAWLEGYAKRFTVTVARRLVITTPGPNLQIPETEYIATGRLRAGWRWALEIGEATNWTEGPYTEDGEDVISAIEAEVQSAPLATVSYLWNNVAYGYLVHEGRGRHKEPRPWVDLVAAPTTVANLAEEAR